MSKAASMVTWSAPDLTNLGGGVCGDRIGVAAINCRSRSKGMEFVHESFDYVKMPFVCRINQYRCTIDDWLVFEPTRLKNMSQNGFIFPN